MGSCLFFSWFLDSTFSIMMNFKEARSLAVAGCLTITLLVPCLAMAQQAAVDKNDFDMSVRAQDDLFAVSYTHLTLPTKA